ncbi:MAG: acyl-CoA dehydrogenase, partial [Betaproteobacteria bacterium]|nr:acyl-CoA dehydrogenase [Betaproteobacteria bacterium]
MDFEFSSKVKDLQARLNSFMEEHVYPNENAFHAEVEANRRAGNAWIPTELIESLKVKAREQGLWNLWRPKAHGGDLTNVE